jgi:hypothetical protein
MNFQVPQFIEIESKIFGPLSFPQFIYVVGGVAIAFLFYVAIPFFYVALIPMIISVLSGAALAFYKVNDRSLIFLVQSMIKYYTGSKLYLWKKDVAKKDVSVSEKTPEIDPKKIYGDKLHELSWSLDVKENIK